MTREEALIKIEELKKFVKEMGEKVGFERDEIFLLSTDEYVKYKDKIPNSCISWWLRSPGHSSEAAAYVLYDGSVSPYWPLCRQSIRSRASCFEN